MWEELGYESKDDYLEAWENYESDRLYEEEVENGIQEDS